MGFMFWGCSTLEEIYLSNFKTNKVTNMRAMFSGCSSLKELNIDNFDTINVKSIDRMFSGCSEELIMKIKTRYKNIKEEAFKHEFNN